MPFITNVSKERICVSTAQDTDLWHAMHAVVPILSIIETQHVMVWACKGLDDGNHLAGTHVVKAFQEHVKTAPPLEGFELNDAAVAAAEIEAAKASDTQAFEQKEVPQKAETVPESPPNDRSQC